MKIVCVYVCVSPFGRDRERAICNFIFNAIAQICHNWTDNLPIQLQIIIRTKLWLMCNSTITFSDWSWTYESGWNRLIKQSCFWILFQHKTLWHKNTFFFISVTMKKCEFNLKDKEPEFDWFFFCWSIDPDTNWTWFDWRQDHCKTPNTPHRSGTWHFVVDTEMCGCTRGAVGMWHCK